MSDTDEFKQGEFYGKVLQELSSLKVGQERIEQSFHDFKRGMGERVETHGNLITTLTERMKVIYWLLAAIGVGLISATSKYAISFLVSK